jgi:broad specificity phosphatase PhoE
MTSTLILVKHAMPEVDPARPAAEWRLGDEGRVAARRIAEELRRFEPVAVVASVEPKAWETAAIVAQRLRVPCEAAAGLHEHEWPIVDFGDRATFEARVRTLFERPDELVFGAETASQAVARFERAVEGALAKRASARALMIVSHGTVISLLAAKWCAADGFALWRSLGLPSFVTISLPERRLLEVAPDQARPQPGAPPPLEV